MHRSEPVHCDIENRAYISRHVLAHPILVRHTCANSLDHKISSVIRDQLNLCSVHIYIKETYTLS